MTYLSEGGLENLVAIGPQLVATMASLASLDDGEEGGFTREPLAGNKSVSYYCLTEWDMTLDRTPASFIYVSVWILFFLLFCVLFIILCILLFC